MTRTPIPGAANLERIVATCLGAVAVLAVFLLSLPTPRNAGPAAQPEGGEGSMIKTSGPPPNFQSVCQYSHSASDDPIVHPRHGGASHLHDFFGNRSTHHSSTYASLRAAETTCEVKGDTAAYWLPAFYDSGQRIQPEYVNIYYSNGSKDHRTIRAFPAGLKSLTYSVTKSCQGTTLLQNPDGFPTCGPGSNLILLLGFPDCWDGKNIDSVDHKRHMTFARGSCPASHPVPMPKVALIVLYKSDGGDVKLGSLEEPAKPHADFINAWDQSVLERLVATCVNAGRDCARNADG